MSTHLEDRLLYADRRRPDGPAEQGGERELDVEQGGMTGEHLGTLDAGAADLGARPRDEAEPDRVVAHLAAHPRRELPLDGALDRRAVHQARHEGHGAAEQQQDDRDREPPPPAGAVTRRGSRSQPTAPRETVDGPRVGTFLAPRPRALREAQLHILGAIRRGDFTGAS
jgi:hypothetical protein